MKIRSITDVITNSSTEVFAYVNEGTIKIFDPGSNATSMWDEYKWANTSTIQCFKKG